ncbi:helix-turn-helix domain-containing protein [Rhizobium multihospitium]|uniref:Helix-turn-helix domain-containing protein n=1 Tax=Rhizobium multihospitium TaxID=410764 RepID=A0A1C3X5W6_9HYPH|nr:helix-turn-helix domain-containing protein [Rhizobium multihospitium]SCB47404.1 Helix-turn-helix domain-containing protein [Rhizobium multihospitium]
MLRHSVAADVMEQAGLLSAWEQTYTQMSPGRFEGTIVEVDVGGMKLARERMNVSVHHVATPMDGWVGFTFPVDRDKLRYLDWRHRMPSKSVVMTHDKIYHGLTTQDSDVVIYSVPIELLRSHLHDLKVDAGPLLQHQIVLSSDFIEYGLWVIDTAKDGLDTQSAAAAQSTILDYFATAVCNADALLAGASSWRADRQTAVTKACASAYASGLGDASLSTMCEASGVSLRVLQQAFKEVMGMPPIKWLRMARLNAVRQALRDRTCSSVTQVAMDYSFYHLGRFSAEYKKLFHEAPNWTMARRAITG